MDVDPADDPGQRQDEQVARETGIDTARVERSAALKARCLDLVDIRGAVFGSVPPRATRGDDVLALAQQTANLIGIRPERRVEHAIGVKCLDGRLVVGREHTARLETGELAGILTYLLRTVAEHPNQLEGGVVDEMAEPNRSDVANAPLDNAIFLVNRHVERRLPGRRCERHCFSSACAESRRQTRQAERSLSVRSPPHSCQGLIQVSHPGRSTAPDKTTTARCRHESGVGRGLFAASLITIVRRGADRQWEACAIQVSNSDVPLAKSALHAVSHWIR